MRIYIIATPIGNLADISQRALETLQRVDFILCENTLHSKKLLDFYGVKKPLISYHQHSKLQKTAYIVSLLKQGKSLALITDAGTPGIADPGGKLIKEVLLVLPQTEIIPIPGASALTAALSISGLPADKFLFMGFPPTKKGRRKFFKEILSCQYTVVFYESCHRILKTLKELGSFQVVVCREITKKFETIYRGTAAEIANQLQQEFPSGKIKGEFVLIVYI